MELNKYLEKFNTKEKVLAELERLQEELKLIPYKESDKWFEVGRRKIALYNMYKKKYCKEVMYFDDLGRMKWLVKEI